MSPCFMFLYPEYNFFFPLKSVKSGYVARAFFASLAFEPPSPVFDVFGWALVFCFFILSITFFSSKSVKSLCWVCCRGFFRFSCCWTVFPSFGILQFVEPLTLFSDDAIFGAPSRVFEWCDFFGWAPCFVFLYPEFNFFFEICEMFCEQVDQVAGRARNALKLWTPLGSFT